jgi:hypothetical protein
LVSLANAPGRGIRQPHEARPQNNLFDAAA